MAWPHDGATTAEPEQIDDADVTESDIVIELEAMVQAGLTTRVFADGEVKYANTALGNLFVEISDEGERETGVPGGVLYSAMVIAETRRRERGLNPEVDESGFMAAIKAEVARQDALHPAGYPADRDGIRLGLASAGDERAEALEAWANEKPNNGLPPDVPNRVAARPQAPWPQTTHEVLQLAAVAIRLYRNLHA